jgi:hypothetical protein
MGKGLGLMRSFYSLSGNWDREVCVLKFSLIDFPIKKADLEVLVGE